MSSLLRTPPALTHSEIFQLGTMPTKAYRYHMKTPDHWTQGEDLEDLKASPRGLFDLFSHEEISGIYLCS
ncbi:MAG: hypothetical protein QM627_03415 [Luteolibacter sp.]